MSERRLRESLSLFLCFPFYFLCRRQTQSPQSGPSEREPDNDVAHEASASNRSRIPIELFQPVVELAEKKEILVLCRVSRLWGLEAERILYREVRLGDSDAIGEQLLTFCHAIIEHPHRAASVRSLYLPDRFGVPDNGQSDLQSPQQLQDALSRAFQIMSNLKELSIRGKSDGSTTPPHPTVLPATFEGCHFQLTGLSGRLPNFRPHDVWKILRTHPDICYWVPDVPLLNSILSIPSGILPSLSDLVLVCPERLIEDLDGSPLRRVVLVFVQPIYTSSDVLAVVRSLSRFRNTMSNLVLLFVSPIQHLTCEDIVSEVAQNVPKLKSLSLAINAKDIIVRLLYYSEDG